MSDVVTAPAPEPPSGIEVVEHTSRSGLARVRKLIAPGATLLVWIYVYLIALLGGWVLLATTVAGWDPVVVTSGSMEPAIRTGDVLLVSEHPDGLVAQRSVVTFERDDGEPVVHRVFTVVDNSYVTKGDANPSPDAALLSPDDVQGVGRLVVPVIGLPVVWAANGDIIPLAAWGVLTLAAIVYVLGAAWREIRRRSGEPRFRDQAGAVASAGIRRVRALVAVMIAIQYVVDPSRLDASTAGGGRLGVLIISVGVLLGLNLASTRIGRRGPRQSRYMALAELMIDTALVVFIATATGTAGIGWVLFALPVIEAAVRFGLTGGLIHWMVLTTLTIGARIGFAQASAGNGLLLGDLEAVLDQLSVLFIVVIPGAYLAEQLIGDVLGHQRATSAAVGRGELLERVVSSGHEVNRLGDHHLDALNDGVIALGYDSADIVLSMDGTTWSCLASRGEPVKLPAAGDPGSGLTQHDLTHSAVVVSHDDPDQADRTALEAAGFLRVIAITVSDGDRGRVVLRAGKTPPDTVVDTARIDALRLLAGQAAVALQNDQLLDQLTSVHDELKHQATHDALTGLPNRPRMLREVRSAVATDTETVLLFLDLDGFKLVNDRLGHDAGDELLRIVADRIRTVAGDEGLVARLGGDEFTILLSGPSARHRAPEMASAIHAALTQPVRLGTQAIHIGASVGLAESEEGMDGLELLRRADVAMYHAKRVVQDDSPFVTYSTELDASESRRADLANDLVPAINDGSIHLVYQPILSVGRSERIVGVEALVRWSHPMHGAIGPEELVQVAEDVGHGDELQRFIVHRATEDAASLVEEHPADGLFVTVNVSPAELRSPATIHNIEDALAVSGLAAESLLVEISERLVDPDEEAVAATMRALKESGVKLLLDDFGEGRTSLSFLHQLPVSGIKLDRRLVLNSATSETERIVVESIIELSRRLNLTVIAEGVETSDHLATITRAGCTIVQGYHFHPPLPLATVATLLRQQGRRVSEPTNTEADRPDIESAVR